MCGIFGIISDEAISPRDIKRLATNSQRRGRDSSGMTIYSSDKYIVQKADYDILRLISACSFDDARVVLGHTRLITDGERDNQPVILDGVLVIHNGIITNKDEFWRDRSEERKFKIDTEVIARIVADHLHNGGSLDDIYDQLINETKGSMSCAILLPRDGKLLLLSNTGSLYLGIGNGAISFASERSFLKGVDLQVSQIKGQVVLNVPVGVLDTSAPEISSSRRALIPQLIDPLSEENCLEYSFPEITRCTKCILPATMPFIKFDNSGICNYCRNYEPKKIKGAHEFEGLLERYRPEFGNRVIVPFSGGRDSTYMVSKICNDFGLEVTTMTYDWGMVTDLARRNISRVCGALEEYGAEDRASRETAGLPGKQEVYQVSRRCTR